MSDFTADTRADSRHCERHGDYEATIVTVLGRDMPVQCPQCVAEREEQAQAEADRQARARKAQRIDAIRQRSGIPLRFSNAAFGGYQPPTRQAKANHALCREYARQFSERLNTGGGLVLCGKPGTGKTHLACAIANHAINQLGKSAVYTSVTKLARTVKSTFSRDAEQTEAQAIASFVAPDLLIIDEVGAQRGSETELLLAQEIIDERYQQLRPTIVISNLPEIELAQFIGERAIDRMYEGGGAVLAFDWGSYRRGAA